MSVAVISSANVATCTDTFALGEYIRYAAFMVNDARLDNNQRRVTLWSNREQRARTRLNEVRENDARFSNFICNLLKKV